MSGFNSLLTIVAVIIIIGLILRYGGSSVALVKALGSAAYQETTVLTLGNTSNVNYPTQSLGTG
jgi:hypothetical protein